MKIQSQLGELRKRVLSSVYRRNAELKTAGPVVSFCFDDFPRTAYRTAGKILNSFHVRGTYYAALGLMNQSNELGDQMTFDDLDGVLSDGHELGSHTFSHLSSRRVSLDTFEQDALRGRDAIHTMMGCQAGNFAYPYGHATVSAKKRIGSLMNSCRGIYGGINGPVLDLNLLRANSLYGDTDQFPKAESLLREGARRGGWLIFYTHDVRPNPSPFGCTPELLHKSIELTLELGFRVAPIHEMVNCADRLQLQSVSKTTVRNTEK